MRSSLWFTRLQSFGISIVIHAAIAALIVGAWIWKTSERSSNPLKLSITPLLVDGTLSKPFGRPGDGTIYCPADPEPRFDPAEPPEPVVVSFIEVYQGFMAEYEDLYVDGNQLWRDKNWGPGNSAKLHSMRLADQWLRQARSKSAFWASNEEPSIQAGVTALANHAISLNNYSIYGPGADQSTSPSYQWLRKQLDLKKGKLKGDAGQFHWLNHSLTTYGLISLNSTSRIAGPRLTGKRMAKEMLLCPEPCGGWASLTLLMVASMDLTEHRQALSIRVKQLNEHVEETKPHLATALNFLHQAEFQYPNQWLAHPSNPEGTRFLEDAEYLLTQIEQLETNPMEADLVSLLATTYALMHSNSHSWDRWRKAVCAALLKLQRQDQSEFRGSWDPIGSSGRQFGRVYTTAICLELLNINRSFK